MKNRDMIIIFMVALILGISMFAWSFFPQGNFAFKSHGLQLGSEIRAYVKKINSLERQSFMEMINATLNHTWKGAEQGEGEGYASHNNSGLKILSYALYGSDPRYIEGAHANAELIAGVFPGWTMRVYHDNTVPPETLNFLREHKAELVDMTGDEIRNKMSWRFLPAGQKDVSIFASRDIDARLSPREWRAVREWEDSDQRFHVLRDHPSHSNFAVSGGMWGSVGGAIPDIRQRLLKNALQNVYLADMNFLNAEIWPLMVSEGVMVHDSFSCDRKRTRPFPTPRIGTEHVGSVYIHGSVRKGDADILRDALNAGQPQC